MTTTKQNTTKKPLDNFNIIAQKMRRNKSGGAVCVAVNGFEEDDTYGVHYPNTDLKITLFEIYRKDDHTQIYTSLIQETTNSAPLVICHINNENPEVLELINNGSLDSCDESFKKDMLEELTKLEF